MPVNVEFQRDNRLAFVRWSNPVMQEDFSYIFNFMDIAYQEAKLPIHNIYIAMNINNLPPRAISTYLKDPRSPLVHPMSGLLIVVTNSFFIKAVADTTAKLSSTDKLKIVQTLEEAMVQIEQTLEQELSR